tara:strand:- start:1827 stop:2117 length:291 start_codon:yes stop_codon:yes gene_type:complete
MEKPLFVEKGQTYEKKIFSGGKFTMTFQEDELYYIDDKRIYNYKLIENDDYEPNKECTSCDVEYTCWDCEAEQIRERYPEARYTDHLEWIVPNGTK